MRGAFVRNLLHVALSTATSMVAISAPLAGNQLNRAQVIFVLTLTATSISAFRLLLENDRDDSRYTRCSRPGILPGLLPGLLRWISQAWARCTLHGILASG